MTIFWDIAPCSLVETNWRFRGTYCLHHQNVEMMEAISISEKSVNFYQTMRCNIQENSHLHTRRRENLIFHLDFIIYYSIFSSSIEKLRKYIQFDRNIVSRLLVVSTLSYRYLYYYKFCIRSIWPSTCTVLRHTYTP
jgi:hypothetical protein